MSVEVPWCVLVSGSRELTDRHRSLILGELREFLAVPLTVVIHGGALGADQIAHDIAESIRKDVLCIRARWTQLGKKVAGPVRNSLLADILLAYGKNGYRMAFRAFPVADSRGTQDMVKKIEALQKQGHVIDSRTILVTEK